ncbi:HET domain protein [Colletotrichum chrysophilum]|uniref:HET domain protein n=1 Tax=Colletotrichum chrysophilum TaxID=1836956 RepID=A0AAD9EUB3_9PEZI|nr:HET domain protein [Colletotrichum chrysophilum]
MSSSSNEEALLHTPTLGKLQDDTGSSEKDLESLCRDCEAVDWSKITIYDDIEGIQTDLPTYHGDRQMKVLRIFKNPSSDIDPQAFVLEADSWNPSDSDTGYAKCVKIRVRSPKSGVQHLGVRDDYKRWLIAHKYPSSESVQIRVLRPSQVCFDFFRLKLEECYNGHEKCCSSATASVMVDLRLIDVHTKQIITASRDCKYIALSYMWGDTSAHNVEGLFPLVVEDAMSATKALGCQYLWVDQCQMDRVYGNAFATIIAASGKSSEEGLPGMSGPPRRQEVLKFGDINVVELLNSGQETVKSGKWVTRGGTQLQAE